VTATHQQLEKKKNANEGIALLNVLSLIIICIPIIPGLITTTSRKLDRETLDEHILEVSSKLSSRRACCFILFMCLIS
jgi:hypothetical protein